jgi:hypothetical protein
MRVFFGKSCVVLLSIFLGSTVAPAQQQVVDVNSTGNQGQSLGDLARKVRKDHTDEVQMSDEDAKKLFSSVDEILTFASGDTGFPQKASVKRRLVGSADVEKYTREQQAKQGFAQRFTRSELTMKKFGLLPRDFDLREFLVKANGKQIAAYYDFETKTISMLNWIPLDKQKPILAHELTHALQDQNYNLKTWMKLDEKEEEPAVEATSKQDDDGVATVRRAVVEGQAQVVYLDYVLAPFNRTVQNTPGLIYQMEEPAVQAVADSELLHNAPMIVRELGTFPYKEGLIFEGELLQKGGKAMAFAGAFTHPPRTTHEVLQPKAYLDHETLPTVVLPDFRAIVGAKYAVYDSGSVGELDLRALFKQFGERRGADDLAAAWQGGRYVAFRKTGDASAAPSLADLALVYVSRWKSPQAAGRFAKLYADSVAQRYLNAAPDTAAACTGNQCPVASGRFSTETGPVIIEQWADNTVLVSESFDSATAARLLNAVRDEAADAHADNFQSDELGLRLMEAPGFSAFQDSLGDEVRDQLATAANP